MKEVSDVLQFVILKSGPKVCSFISVRECVFDLHCMSAVVVETIVSNFFALRNFAKSFNNVMKPSVKRSVPFSVPLETEHCEFVCFLTFSK
jgi:hypothetical protein